jgi:hypothetical protein
MISLSPRMLRDRGPMVTTNDDARLTAISVEKRCACPFSIAQEYAQQYLQRSETGGRNPLVVYPFALPFFSFRRSVAMSFSVASDETEPGRAHDRVLVRWNSGFGLLPDFSGTIRFRPDRAGTLVMIDGSYKPPFGRPGAVFDRLIGKWIATNTISDLLRRITSSLEEQQRVWLAKQPAVAGP